MGYSVDTSGLMDAWDRWYPPDVFPSMWAHLSELAERQVIVASEEVLHDLEKKDDDLFQWVKSRKEHFIFPHDDAVQQAAAEILAQFPRMVDQRTNKSLADPFVVALARVKQLAVVTGEKGGTQDKPKIPSVCQHFGIKCISVLEMIRELGIKF